MSSDNVAPVNPLGREIAPPGSGGLGGAPPSQSGGPQGLAPAGPGGNPAAGAAAQGGPAPPGNPQGLAPAGPGGNPVSGASGPTLSPAVQQVLADCEVIIDQYRRQRLTKSKALHEIYQKLLSTGPGDTLNIELSFSSFLKAIEDHDQQEREAVHRGGGHAPAPGGGAGPAALSDAIPPAPERQGGRSSALEAQFPWAVTEFIESSIQPLSPGLTETLNILKILLQDPKLAKRSITTSARPPEFPDSEWTNLVNGRAVNLDAVLSGLFSTITDDERSESIGSGLEIRFGAVAPAKIVNDAGTWTIAFDRMCAATLFVFAHRAKELASYREYIVGLFAATSPLFHDRIISFDKAVRKRVTQRRDVELTDFNKFIDIKTAVIDSIGVGVVDAQREPSSGPTRKVKLQPCNNWNNGRCSADAGACRRLHICNVCKTAGHKGPDCPDRPQN
ncbi:hypothetical protein C8J57DRAFT_1518615 [Mycena rebaudengoi]|nr:hypothetical protein C8J57DRAFT_1518615 [Mycena rebaudengoi]